ncbi:Fe(3+)-citrate ABC transporter substrate-binding protein YfmC [Bacillus inaquosorum]|uniref:Fe(3+)-citrate ABC transporter substrate-binding protein YfmC n=1 Tax=Bacillus inaquosorum TaxID=483913 RepID=UPI002280B3E7|nr:Fe(3+)-citrate ABC transporter substrate-binding protein YfmC [Bacillus inaquosorum]MCY9010164.1 Fe(3+)-citrate ABC transporter substrate-binding protein YfmC [Bacillus inaquosorum]MCY9028026.1 Fe(3+)-citrate ABC transporter substrate-binding protein YfmC [Bacillus inaquosorum]MCY9035743.1 Fe(3+)-citrate ABC transporter substrate-binding protein YfmC [Bacillus inaquosorum]MCY9047109.1 Fe(3+)-citrate ABC transporter substrate-binding protein YfmC [Bacillus inaquosorum]MCY9057658.1 Fe(3+)-cit
MRTYSNKLIAIMSVLLIACFIVSGCSSSQNNSGSSESKSKDSRVIQHEEGKTPVSGTPKRVVVLELSFLDAVYNLGITPVGIADDNKKDMIKKLVGSSIDYTSVGTRSEPNLEVISSLKPDIIIADAERHKNIYKQLKQIAPTIELKSREATYDETIDSFTTIAKALNKEDEGKEKLAEHNKVINDLKAELPKDENRNIVLGVARADSFQLHTSSSYDGEIFKMLGFTHAVKSNEAYQEVSLEQLSKIDPDILFISANEGKTIVDEWKTNPLWKNLKAVKIGQVYDADRDTWTRFRGIKSSETSAKDVLKKVYNK